MRAAVVHHNAGQLAYASDICRMVLQIEPTQTDALNLSGLIAHQTGDSEQAVNLIRQAIGANKRVPDYHNNLGNILIALGRFAEAEACFREALILAPSAEAHNNLGSAVQRQGRMTDAIGCYRRAVKQKPDSPVMWNNLGFALQSAGEPDEAMRCYRRALEIAPDYCDALLNMGNVLSEKGLHAEGIESYRRLIQIEPGFAIAHNNLGDALKNLGRLAEATECYRRAVKLKPDNLLMWNNLGGVLQVQGATEEAISCYRHALEFAPDNVDAMFNLGNAFCDEYRFDEAITSFESVLQMQPNMAVAHNNLGHALQRQGRLAEALASFEVALTVNPDFGEAWQNYLFSLNYASGRGAQEIFEAHVKFGSRLEEAVAGQNPAHSNERDPGKRLKIGYVSPDFRAHAVAYFIEPVLEQHESKEFEAYCYFNNVASDEVTQRLKALAHHWRDIAGQPDEEVAKLIRRDGIDILVDLAGHTAGNRLGVFTRKPAPVQVTWLGYLSTTGLDSIDYRITDVNADPVGLGERYYTEELVRLPDTFVCYRPAEHSPGMMDALPALKNGYITFASFNNLAKITPEVRALWARVLLAVPGSRLRLKTKGLNDAQMRRRLVEDFARHDVPKDRLQLVAWDSSHTQHLNRYTEVDISLDPFPCNGGTTSFDAMWMGVPVVTLAGNSFISRMGVSMLTSLGLTELVANTPEDYVAIAARLAGDLGRLAVLRAGLRERMANSPLTDAKKFTLNLEKAYRKMWGDWCGQSSPTDRCMLHNHGEYI